MMIAAINFSCLIQHTVKQIIVYYMSWRFTLKGMYRTRNTHGLLRQNLFPGDWPLTNVPGVWMEMTWNWMHPKCQIKLRVLLKIILGWTET